MKRYKQMLEKFNTRQKLFGSQGKENPLVKVDIRQLIHAPVSAYDEKKTE